MEEVTTVKINSKRQLQRRITKEAVDGTKEAIVMFDSEHMDIQQAQNSAEIITDPQEAFVYLYCNPKFVTVNLLSLDKQCSSKSH